MSVQVDGDIDSELAFDGDTEFFKRSDVSSGMMDTLNFNCNTQHCVTFSCPTDNCHTVSAPTCGCY
jgi:hypothetical protein